MSTTGEHYRELIIHIHTHTLKLVHINSLFTFFKYNFLSGSVQKNKTVSAQLNNFFG